MPTVKAFLMVLSILALSFLLIGCGFIADRDAEPEEAETAEAGKLPGWLLSEHRSEQQEEEPLKPKDPDQDETDELAEPDPAEETVEPETEPTQETAAPQEPSDDHAVEADPGEPANGEEQEPQPEQVTDQVWQRGTYTGAWLDGQPHGQGTFNHPSGGTLTGNWVEGTPHGQFTLTAPDGSTDTVYFEQGQIAEAPDDHDGGEEANWWEPDSGSGGGWF